jgi:hypothetical protein
MLHVKQGHLFAPGSEFAIREWSHGPYVSQYKTEPSPILSRPASRRAFSSAWRHRQVERLTPEPCPLLHRAPSQVRPRLLVQWGEGCSLHPPSLQFRKFLGVPLYPVLMTLLSLTSTQPTRLFMQLHLCAARLANCMKY